MYWDTEWQGKMQEFGRKIKGKKFLGLGVDGRVFVNGSYKY
jgi:hypothetical protein